MSKEIGKFSSGIHYFLNPDHTYRECDLMTWADQFEKDDRQVAFDTINDSDISTVWLGINHNCNVGRPLVFETMVFKPGYQDIYQARHSTWDEALAGHQKAVQWVRDGCKEEDL